MPLQLCHKYWLNLQTLFVLLVRNISVVLLEKDVDLYSTNLMGTPREAVLMVRLETTKERPTRLWEAWTVQSGQILVCTLTTINPVETISTLTTVGSRIPRLGRGVTLLAKTKDGITVTSLMDVIQVSFDASGLFHWHKWWVGAQKIIQNLNIFLFFGGGGGGGGGRGGGNSYSEIYKGSGSGFSECGTR